MRKIIDKRPIKYNPKYSFPPFWEYFPLFSFSYFFIFCFYFHFLIFSFNMLHLPSFIWILAEIWPKFSWTAYSWAGGKATLPSGHRLSGDQIDQLFCFIVLCLNCLNWENWRIVNVIREKYAESYSTCDPVSRSMASDCWWPFGNRFQTIIIIIIILLKYEDNFTESM